MPTPLQPSQFRCPHCSSTYRLVRMEVPVDPQKPAREITCLNCGGPLRGREGVFLLKYFLVDRTSERLRRSA
jgi:hypothetical protein